MTIKIENFDPNEINDWVKKESIEFIKSFYKERLAPFENEIKSCGGKYEIIVDKELSHSLQTEGLPIDLENRIIAALQA